MTRESARKHVFILGALHVALNLVGFTIAAIVFAVLSGIGLSTGSFTAFAAFTTIAYVATAVLMVVSLPGLVAGIGLLRRARWGRTLGLVAGALLLLDVPIGTALGVYTFWVLLDGEVVRMLEVTEA